MRCCLLQAIYTPSKIDGGQVLEYENGLAAANSQMLKNFNTSLLALQPASQAGVQQGCMVPCFALDVVPWC